MMERHPYQACQDCATACRQCADACLREQRVDSLVECIRLDRDCARLCELAVALITSNSRFAASACDLCARSCDACAAECEQHAHLHEHCQWCADACRRCADECRAMAGLTDVANM